MLRRLWLFGPPVFHCALIFWLSHQPDLPSTPGGDKTAHLAAYAVMGILFVRAFYFGTGWRPWVLVLISFFVSALYGVSDELHQSFVPGRDASLGDVLADTAGAFLGSVGAFFSLEGLRRLTPFTRFVQRDTGGGWSDTSSPPGSS